MYGRNGMRGKGGRKVGGRWRKGREGGKWRRGRQERREIWKGKGEGGERKGRSKGKNFKKESKRKE